MFDSVVVFRSFDSYNTNKLKTRHLQYTRLFKDNHAVVQVLQEIYVLQLECWLNKKNFKTTAIEYSNGSTLVKIHLSLQITLSFELNKNIYYLLLNYLETWSPTGQVHSLKWFKVYYIITHICNLPNTKSHVAAVEFSRVSVLELASTRLYFERNNGIYRVTSHSEYCRCINYGVHS